MIYFELTLLEDVDADSIDASDPPEILARSASQ